MWLRGASGGAGCSVLELGEVGGHMLQEGQSAPVPLGPQAALLRRIAGSRATWVPLGGLFHTQSSSTPASRSSLAYFAGSAAPAVNRQGSQAMTAPKGLLSGLVGGRQGIAWEHPGIGSCPVTVQRVPPWVVCLSAYRVFPCRGLPARCGDRDLQAVGERPAVLGADRALRRAVRGDREHDGHRSRPRPAVTWISHRTFLSFLQPPCLHHLAARNRERMVPKGLEAEVVLGLLAEP